MDFALYELGPGQYFGEYKIVDFLGRGGMGAVYSAIHEASGRKVAIKLIFNKELGTTEKRFLREAEITADLSHPNIVKIYTAGAKHGVFYLVMEYIKGVTLDKYMRNSNMSIVQKIRLLYPLAKALAYAHTKNVVHRDLKPNNIMIDHNDVPKLMDFGLAKNVESDRFSLTQSGEFAGTPHYMAPEVLLGKPKEIDFRVDIYSFGAILYQIVTGKMMVAGKKSEEVFQNIRYSKPVMMNEYNTNVPKELNKIWMLCVAEKKMRYQTTELMVEDLGNFLNLKKSSRFRRPRWLFTPLHGVILACIILISVIIVFHDDLVKNNDSSSVKIDSEVLLIRAKNSLKQKNFNDAVYELQPLIKRNNYNALPLLIEAYVRLGKYPLAKQLFEKHYYQQKNVPHNVLLHMAIVYKIAQAQDKKYIEMAHDALQKIIQSKNADANILQKAYFYRGVILFEDHFYSQALSHFLHIEASLVNDKDILNRLFFYLGVCYLEIGKLQKAASFLKRAEIHFPNDSEVLFFLGQVYLKQNLAFRAKKCFSKSLAIEPDNRKYKVFYAQSLLKQGQNVQCQHILQDIFVSEEEPNFNVFSGLCELGIFEPITQHENLILMRHEFTKKFLPLLPNLFIENLIAIRDKYFLDFQERQHLKSKKKVDLEPILQSLRDSQNSPLSLRISDHIYRLRYQKNIVRDLKNLAKNGFADIKIVIYEIANKIITQKKQEYIEDHYYHIAQIFVDKNYFRRYEKYIDSDVVFEILTTHSSVFYKYLAARCLVKLYDIDRLDQISLQSKLLDSSIIATCVLREYGFPIVFSDEDYRYDVFDTTLPPEQQKFLLYLVCCSVYNHTNFVYKIGMAMSERTLGFLKKMLNNDDERIRLCAAGTLLSSVNSYSKSAQIKLTKKLQQQCRSIVMANLHNVSANIRRYAYLYLWFSLSLSRDFQEIYFEHYKKGIQDKDTSIILTNLFFSDLFYLQEKFSSARPLLRELILRERKTTLMFKATDVWAQTRPDKTEIRSVLSNERLTYGEKTFVYTMLFVHFVSEMNGKVTRKNLRSALGVIELISEDIPQDPDEFFRGQMYFHLSLFGQPNLSDIYSEESDIVKAIILTHLHLPIVRGSFMRFLLKLSVPQQYEKRNCTKKFLSSPNDQIRKASYISFTALTNTHRKLKALVKKAKNSKDEMEKQGVAIGLYHRLIYYEVLREEDYARYIALKQPIEVKYQKYIDKLQAVASQRSGLQKKWLEMLSWAIELAPEAKYFYEKALLLKSGRVEEKLMLLNKAIAIDDYALYRLELAKSIWTERGKSAKIEIINELKKIKHVNRTELLEKIADLYNKLGMDKESKKIYYKLFLAKPFLAEYANNMATLYAKKSDERFEQFESYFKLCLQIRNE
ncbi:protein kinase [Candidatus Uabimicrobium sp. HlEnr_7]|uniref:protein kinase domain-containing protein n=1 Tax=Candidatus Uabimicrobium helgolandensis TaxID=3095367 RepID=UPI0035569B4E